jgi:hypothetical protein
MDGRDDVGVRRLGFSQVHISQHRLWGAATAVQIGPCCD